MIDNLRSILILVTSLATIMIGASKFFFNLPLNLIKLNYKLDTEDASFVESVASVFIALVYGSLLLLVLISIIMNFLGAWHVKSTGVNEQPIYKVRTIVLMIQVALASTEVCLILIFMDLKLTRKASTCMKIAAPIYILSVITILISILGWFVEYSCYSLNSRLIINDTSICLGNLNLNNAEKNDTDVYLNGVNIISDGKKTGKLVIANSNKKLTFNIDPTIKVKEYDDLTINIKGMKGIHYSYNFFKEILNFVNQCSNIVCYCIFILISAGVFRLNLKLGKRRKYILKTKDSMVECFWFLSYNDYYVVIDENERIYISKKDIDRIFMKELNIKKRKYLMIKKVFQVICKFIIYIPCQIYIMFKLLVIPGIILDLLIVLFNFLLFKKINNFFFLDNRRKKIVQGLTLKKYIDIWNNNYFKHRITLLKQLLKLGKNETFNSPYIKKYRGEKIKCTTNEIIYKSIFKRNIKQDNLLKNKNSVVKKPQPFEKLVIMNCWVLWRNIINIKFWKYIYRVEKISEYSFIVDDELLMI